jgi:hypothetical protein
MTRPGRILGCPLACGTGIVIRLLIEIIGRLAVSPYGTISRTGSLRIVVDVRDDSDSVPENVNCGLVVGHCFVLLS